VVVIGCGGIGMAAINGASIVGAGRIIAVDNNPVKLQLATKLGATDIVDVKNGDPVEQVKELTKGQVHHAIEAVGFKVTAEQAFQMLGPAGVATIIGMIPFGTKIELHGFEFLRGEKKIQVSSMGSNWFRIDMPRLAEAGIEPSVGSVGDSYDNALAETINGPYKAEVIHRRGPWRSFDAVEFATLEWVDWFNNRRLLEPIGNIPPAEAEEHYYATLDQPAMAA
jgi:threonine dehydrogenase-like Zn-dependent dehydrogenase